MSAQPTLSMNERLLALGLAAVLAAPLLVAATLEPAAGGLGTHRQLGLPACGWPIAFGLPCVTCGMTTAFAHAVRGEPLSALWVQPAGAMMAFLAALGVVVCLWDAVSARPVHALLAPLARGRTAWIAAGVLIAAWGWKVLQCRGAAS